MACQGLCDCDETKVELLFTSNAFWHLREAFAILLIIVAIYTQQQKHMSSIWKTQGNSTNLLSECSILEYRYLMEAQCDNSNNYVQFHRTQIGETSVVTETGAGFIQDSSFLGWFCRRYFIHAIYSCNLWCRDSYRSLTALKYTIKTSHVAPCR